MNNRGALPPRHSILLVIGLLMTSVVILGVTGMLTSIVIAQINQGMATAVNQSGTLRMQAYRVGVALTDDRVPLETRRERARLLAAEYDRWLISERLTAVLPDQATDPVRLAYEGVRVRWVKEMRQAVLGFIDAGEEAAASLAETAKYLDRVDDFVAEIHALVRLLEERAERRIRLLRWIQAIALALTVTVVLVTLILVQRRILRPLGELLDCADRIRRGDFSTRATWIGHDELGRVGAAMNLMTEGLSDIYRELEQRVADKTRDLARTNRSLALLYHTSRALEKASLSDSVLRGVLEDFREQLGLVDLRLCLRDVPPADAPASGSGDSPDEIPAETPDNSEPRARDATATSGPSVIGFPVGELGHRFGTLCATLPPGGQLESWRQPLLESLAGHLARSLNLKARIDEDRRLALHEERGILARELHDSLAQSLSYLKIQVLRMEVALSVPQDAPRDAREPALPPASAILSEIRDGIDGAYRQLRELLTTFRLRIDERGLATALSGTVREFQDRANLDIDLVDRLPAGLLTPNEEVHVMRIIREALSNIVRHAGTRHGSIHLERRNGGIDVLITDDGRGLADEPVGRDHFGLRIMRERALSLGGDLQIESPLDNGRGTRIRLHFRPRGLVPEGAATDRDRPGETPPGASTTETGITDEQDT
ncbi:type IV pili methyl-accepting chemotaxis transducer N-terminal domain-containing protein [Thiocystis violascens]|uniref:Sensor protein n=1 Tax=Thiocystis violascens (strain ATCC 17096 / DSM 198 / 6111) TaxID=765911 RepID=I3YGE3_THIV6|nr:type IV pili methyl-accepting chemotaxis transducer N-terminal domain-containing protein [Thiocystis violascens]AFL76061.1 signal transduction histidine kinase, nitrate/nitrite-specific [Thiocystis violascens DSM 198]